MIDTVWRRRARSAALLLLYVSVAGLAAGTILAEFGDRWWIADLFAHFRFQYALAAIAISLCALLLGSRRLAIAAAALIVPQALAIGSVPVADRASFAPQAQRVRIVTANIQGHGHWNTTLAAFFRNSGADLIVLQEVLPYAVPLIQELRKDYPHLAPADWPGRSHVVVLSRHPFEAVRVSYEPYSPLVESIVPHPSGSIRVIAVHAPYPVSSALYEFHTRYFAGWLRQAKLSEAPLVIAGDFNLTPWSVRFRAAWRASGLSFTGDYLVWPRTWPAHAFPLNYFPALLMGGIPIDHVLVSRHFAVAQTGRGPYVGSDHYPVVVDLQLKP